MLLYSVPIALFLVLTSYIIFSLRWAWRRIGSQDGGSGSHSERAYRAFEFFFTVTVAIVGGIGFLRTQCFAPTAEFARAGMILLAGLENVAMAFMVIAVTSHIGSKWERWRMPGTRDNIRRGWWRMVEPWMILFAYGVATAVWVTAHKV